MRTKKIILAIMCVLMMVALTQSTSATIISVANVSLTGVLEWQQGDAFTITFAHGNTETTETYHENDVTIGENINNGDTVVITYKNALTERYVLDGGHTIWEWVKYDICVMLAESGPPSPRTVLDLR